MDFAALGAAVMGAFAEAELAEYAPRNQVPFPVRGILDRYVVTADGVGEGPPVAAPFSSFSVMAADLPPGFVPRAKDRLVIRGITFDVKDVPPADVTGWLVLPLGRIA